MLPLAITPGEPAGIGPDIMLALALQALPRKIVAIASLSMLEKRAALLGLDVRCVAFETSGERMKCEHLPGVLPVIDVPLPEDIAPGEPKISAAPYLLQTLDLAVEGCLEKRFHGMVTGPLQKALLNDWGIAFSGHTEYLADKAGGCDVVMMLASPRMRVALLTTHLPLSQVPQALTTECLDTALHVIIQSMKSSFGVQQPNIGVCGLNPHAGEGGHLGREELDIIQPVISQWQSQGYSIKGPLSADTAFTSSNLAQVDVILAMYHDQGLPVIKAQDFGDTVNITLGLPFIRTSVDHGVALSLAGSGKASYASLLAAVNQAHIMQM